MTFPFDKIHSEVTLYTMYVTSYIAVDMAIAAETALNLHQTINPWMDLA